MLLYLNDLNFDDVRFVVLKFDAFFLSSKPNNYGEKWQSPLTTKAIAWWCHGGPRLTYGPWYEKPFSEVMVRVWGPKTSLQIAGGATVKCTRGDMFMILSHLDPNPSCFWYYTYTVQSTNWIHPNGIPTQHHIIYMFK